ncbi:dihydropteroate synthase [Flavobacteriaceae bacterium]|jgi:dihydropteroate synthase|nr:dihydropteroate synthase [Flavobacteriaceae bacterium]MDC0496927.1 dihydropteroate synthase [Flavobacteriaceae bacterium]MDC0622419.1 dihydropteroate synthase [Flavobacteriaceae bacterium]
MNINCKGKLIDISSPKVMGILNLTPDSFYDGDMYNNEKTILNQVEKMLNDGASFIDLGAYSSRPGATHVSEDEEKNRIIKIVELLAKEFPKANLSIDTFRSSVADECLSAGASIINDITASEYDTEILKVAHKHNAPYIMMHMKGMPGNMMKNNKYNNLIKDILYYFSMKIEAARYAKVNDIIVDPGFGFSKDIDQNYSLLKNLDLLKSLDLPILVGLSRKSMIYKLLETTPEYALNGSTTLNTVALLNGASILRVHDVKEAMECIKITNQFNKQ